MRRLLARWALAVALTTTALAQSPAPTTPPAQTPPAQTQPKRRPNTNRKGHQIPAPQKSDTVPAGATAQCRDGSYSFSETRRGTCSYHGGVAKWLTK